jgi:hypothetical protein
LSDEDESWEYSVLAFEGTKSPLDENGFERIPTGLVARLCSLVVGRLKT